MKKQAPLHAMGSISHSQSGLETCNAPGTCIACQTTFHQTQLRVGLAGTPAVTDIVVSCSRVKPSASLSILSLIQPKLMNKKKGSKIFAHCLS